MKIVVPLAGPDFERPDGSIKADTLVDGRPLLEATLERRPWWGHGRAGPADVVFVLKDTLRARAYGEDALRSRYPGAGLVYISRTTGGTALSALAALSLIGDAEAPVCVDLVDIAYRSAFDQRAAFASKDVGAVALVFPSQNPVYSYLRQDVSGDVVEAAEKRVISDQASAGTYFFANPSIYLKSMAHNLDHRQAVTHKGLFFVCPLYNGVIASGVRVVLEPVSEVVDIKTA